MAALRTHPIWSMIFGATLVVLALWAVLPPPFVRDAEAAKVTLSSLATKINTLQATMDADHVALLTSNSNQNSDDARVPRSWLGLPSGVTQRYQLVLPKGPIPAGSDNYKGVLDHRTGLVWARMPTAVSQSWTQATSLAAKSTLGGTTGWRLPSVAEFSSIMADTNGDNDADQLDPAFSWGRGGVQPPKPQGEFWTAESGQICCDSAKNKFAGDGDNGRISGFIFSFNTDLAPVRVFIDTGLTDLCGGCGGPYLTKHRYDVWLVLGPR